MTSIVKHSFSPDQVALIKRTIMAGRSVPTDDDLALFGLICQRAQLDPFAKQIYAIERKGKWTFQVSVDGLRAIADRTGQYAGSDEPLYDEGLDLYAFEMSGRTLPTLCKVTVWKIVSGVRRPFTGVAKYAEFCQTYENRPSGLWEKMPLNMLAKCAESQALRKAFPQCSQAEQSVKAIEAEPVDTRQQLIDSLRWHGLDPKDPAVATTVHDCLTTLQKTASNLTTQEIEAIVISAAQAAVQTVEVTTDAA